MEDWLKAVVCFSDESASKKTRMSLTFTPVNLDSRLKWKELANTPKQPGR